MSNTSTLLTTLAREKTTVQTETALDAAFRQSTMKKLQAVAESTGSTTPSVSVATTPQATIAVTTESIIDHARARVLAERIDTLASRRFCDMGTLNNGFITDTRLYAAAGCPDMKALNAYVEARLRTENGRNIPQGW